jgi:para-aminobenzoate synthetase component 1
MLEMAAPVPRAKAPSFEPEWQSNFTRPDYEATIQKTIDYIHAGDIFQANISQRFDAELPQDFDPFAHYLNLREMNAAPFATYFNLGGLILSSASPERFLTVKDGIVETKPIKGTRPHIRDDEALDTLYRNSLENSEKDRAENIMIVDLLRNDLSKSCRPDNLKVTALCALESFASVHHLVSTIQGQLRAGYDALHLLEGCFPGGSITGAPKIRAMEIIDELEPTRRGPYCGSMGYIGFDGAMDSNILIRTLVYQGNAVSFQVGGGIVADSDPAEEYDETLTKAHGLLESFKVPRKDTAAQPDRVRRAKAA